MQSIYSTVAHNKMSEKKNHKICQSTYIVMFYPRITFIKSDMTY